MCLYICVYICVYIYIYIYHGLSLPLSLSQVMLLVMYTLIIDATGVCEQTLLLGDLLPCKSAAETALQALVWH